MQPSAISPKLSAHFALMSFVCAVLVVTIHAGVAPVADSWQFYVMQAIDRLNDIAVPYFFVAAGFFLAGSFETPHWYRTAVVKRIKSVLIPFFVWLLIYQLFNMGLVAMAKCLHISFGAETISFNWGGLLYLLGIHPFKLVPIVWFLRMLFFLVLLSPVLAKLGRKAFTPFLAFAFCLWYWHEQGAWGHGRLWSFFEYFFSLRGLFFFASGVYMRRFIFDRFRVPRFASCLIALVAVLSCFVPRGGALATVLLLGSIWWLTGFVTLPPHLSMQFRACAMPIYLMHLPILILMAGVVAGLGMKQWVHVSLLAFMLKLIFSVGVVIVLASLLRRYFPRVTSILMGGR